MNFQAMVMIFACMYIHMSPKLGNFTFSVELNCFIQFQLVKWSFDIYSCFQAMSQSCHMVWEYYDLKGKKPVFVNLGDVIEVAKPASGVTKYDAKANHLCYMNHMYYYSWFGVNFVITLLRMQSLNLMLRGYKFLAKKAED